MKYTAQEVKYIPNDQYSCTGCESVPEIKDIDYDSGTIEINCPNCGEKKIDVLNYFNNELPYLYYSIKCDFSKIEQKKALKKNENDIFVDCKNCNQICCSNCYSHHKGHNNQIKVNEKTNICEQHFKKFVKFCTQCKKNFCSHEKCKCKHDQKNLIEIQKPNEKDIKEIKDKRYSLFKKKELHELLIKLLDTFLETCEKHPNNYYNTANIGNVAERIRVFDSRNDEINRTKILSKMNGLENKILNFFNDKFGTNLKLEDNKLVLKNKNIGNEELELLSHVGFQNLEDIDLSHNKISKIDSFKNFISKKIKRIDLSYNIINDIKPLKKILEKKQFPDIQDIILEYNKIIPKDIEEIKRLIKGEYIKECKLTYILDESENKIRLFGHDFISKNQNNCKIKENQIEKNISEFYDYTKIKHGNTLDITLIMDENIKDLSGMFSECKALKYVKEIFELNKKVEDISNMFSGCSILISLPESMSKWDTSNIKNMSGLFYGCQLLETLPDISNWKTHNVIKMIGLFNGCSTLQKLPDISKWTVSNVEDMSCMFNNCAALQEMPIGMSYWDTSNVKDMGDMFHGCQNLKKLTQLNNWNTKNVTSMKNMFKGCKKLTDPPDVTKWKTANVKEKSDMFAKCPKKYKI